MRWALVFCSSVSAQISASAAPRSSRPPRSRRMDTIRSTIFTEGSCMPDLYSIFMLWQAAIYGILKIATGDEAATVIGEMTNESYTCPNHHGASGQYGRPGRGDGLPRRSLPRSPGAGGPGARRHFQ